MAIRSTLTVWLPLASWSEKEVDELMKQRVDGEKSWEDTAQALGNGRTAKACRRKYAELIKKKDVSKTPRQRKRKSADSGIVAQEKTARTKAVS